MVAAGHYRTGTTYVGVHIDRIETEYYPFEAIHHALEEADLDTEICGLEYD